MIGISGLPATKASSGLRWSVLVIGAALLAAAEQLMLARGQCASSYDNAPYDNAPVTATIDMIAARWLRDVLDLPCAGAVGFWGQRYGLNARLSCSSPAHEPVAEHPPWFAAGRGIDLPATGLQDLAVHQPEQRHASAGAEHE